MSNGARPPHELPSEILSWRRRHGGRRVAQAGIAAVLLGLAGYGAPRVQWNPSPGLTPEPLSGATSISIGSDTVPLFGPRRFDALNSGVAVYVERFVVATTYDDYTLRVENGAADGTARVDSAEIRLNGAVILSPADFDQSVHILTRSVQVEAEDTLEVVLEKGAGKYVNVSLLATPDPTFTFYGPVRIDVTRKNETIGISDTFPLPPDADPPYRVHVINGAEDGTSRIHDGYLNINGTPVLTNDDINEAIAAAVREGPFTDTTYYTTVVKQSPAGSHMVFRFTATDSTPPVIDITSPADGVITSAVEIQVDGTIQDRTTTRVTLNGVEAGVTNNDSFGALVPLTVEGENVIVALATDAAGNQAGDTIRIIRDSEVPVLLVGEPADGLITNADSVTVTGSVQDLTEVSVAVNGIPVTVDPAGSFSTKVSLAEGDNFITVSATDAAGNGTSLTRLVTRDTAPPSLTVSEPVDGATTTSDSITVSGTATDATPLTVTVNSTDFPVATDGSFTGKTALVDGENAIHVTATDAAGNSALVTRTVTRSSSGLPPDPSTVAPPLDATVATNMSAATEFLYTGDNPIQTGVVAGTIDAVRVAVLRGRVVKRDGSPLPGVEISVLGHPELGQTLSRDDGWYDLAVNGGGPLTLQYQIAGRLPGQRRVEVPWQDYRFVPDIRLIELDSMVTTVELSGATEIQVARGSVAQDGDGQRQATVLFEPGTEAYLEMPDGTTQAISTLGVRATEYTIGAGGPEAMPGELPPTSHYTYAAELSVDEALQAGASHVRFSQPVPFYVENFLEFPVGLPVPVGWYDRREARWIPDPDGRIIQILATDGGIADIDTNGDGVADDDTSLNALGLDTAERATLASTYAAGTSLWRAEFTHFSSVDLNYPAEPEGDGEEDGDGVEEEGKEDENDCQPGSSVVVCQSQILQEQIAITGSPFSLNYASDRVPGRIIARTLHVGLTGAVISPTLQRVELEIYVAGRKFKEQFAAAPDLSYSFVWDGLDAYGRPVQGQLPAQVRVGYIYPLVYRVPANVASSFGLPCDATLSGWETCVIPATATDSARQNGGVWREWVAMVGPWDARGQGLGGWTLNVHHTYLPAAQVLQLGTGERRSAGSVSAAMTTFAGNGSAGFAGDGGPAGEAVLTDPSDIGFALDGSIYIADTGNYRVRKVGPDGIITTVAGNGVSGCSGDGGPALQAELGGPTEVLPAPDGGFYIGDHFNHRVRRVYPDGTIWTVAGQGQCGTPDEGTPGTGPYGDGGSATRADLHGPDGLALGQDGSLYIADRGHDRVRRVGPDGIIHTFAGGGGNSLTDGVPATTVYMPRVDGLAMAPDGTLYINVYNRRVTVRVDPAGRVYRVAGNGSAGFSGDGGPATEAMLNGPEGVSLGPDGSIYIADSRNYRIRRVGLDGIINTIAGTGTAAYGGDGGAPERASITLTDRTWFAPDGSLFIAGRNGHRIRRILPQVPGFDNDDILIASEDGREHYHFDPAGKHLRTLHGLTGAVLYAFAYDSVGRLTSITDADGLVTSIERDSVGQPSAILAPFGQSTGVTSDSNGFIDAITNPAGEATGFAYDSVGLLLSITSPRGNVSSYAYDPDGRFVRTEDAAGGSKTLSRTQGQGAYTVALTTALGRTTSYRVETLSTGEQRRITTDPAGLKTVTLFGAGARVTRTDPDGTSTTVSRGGDPRWSMQAPLVDTLTITTPAGLASQIRTRRQLVLADAADPFSLVSQLDSLYLNGRAFVTAYDASLGESTATTPEGRITTTRFDSVGRVLEQGLSGVNPVAYGYDLRGRLTSLSQGSRTRSFSYDPGGRLLSTTDPLLRTDSLFYDSAGRVTRQLFRDGREITYGYDAAGNLMSLAPPGRPAHTFAYNGLGLDSVYDPPDVADVAEDRTFYQYNLDRELTRILRPDGLAIDFAYDAAGRVDAITSPRGVVDYAYSGTTGQLTGITAPGGEALSFAYDGALATAETWSGTVAGQVEFAYDDDFHLSGVAVNGDTIAYGYDNDGLLSATGDLALNRDPLNGLLRSTSMGGVTTRQGHNEFGEVSGDSAWANGVLVFARTYERDDLGRIRSVEDLAEGLTTVWGYGYDDAGRLETVTRGGAAYATYEYDTNGNRLSRISPLGVETGVYDEQDRMLSYAGAEYTYTANGELSMKVAGADTTRYEYDVFGNLVRVALTDGTVIEYVIDGRHRRVGKKVDDVLVQGFLYGDQLNPVAELDGSGNVVSRFIYGSKANVPDYMIRGGETFRILSDHLGSVRLVVNVSTGSIAQRLSYDAWGRVVEDTNSGWQPFGFAGGVLERGLVRFGVRDYHADAGVFTTPDPAVRAGLVANSYHYAGGDPINRFDLDGRIPLPVITGGIGFVGGFLGGLITSGGDVSAAFRAGIAGGAIGAAVGLLPFAPGLAAADQAFLQAISAGIANMLVNGGMQTIESLLDPCYKFNGPSLLAALGAGMAGGGLAGGLAGNLGAGVVAGLSALFTTMFDLPLQGALAGDR